MSNSFYNSTSNTFYNSTSVGIANTFSTTKSPLDSLKQTFATLPKLNPIKKFSQCVSCLGVTETNKHVCDYCGNPLTKD